MIEKSQHIVVFSERGADPHLAVAEIPKVDQGEVLVKVAACALNFADLLALKERYQEKTVWPHTPGMEISGIVEAVGHGVDQEWQGQRVAAFVGRGGLAEYLNVPLHRAIRLPQNVDLETAAALPVAYGSSHLALTRNAGLQSGQTLVVLGASGGVGLTAVEIGKKLGARVIGCARGPEKCEIARAAGADITFDTGIVDLKSELRALGGVDVVYDAVGGDLGAAAFGALKPGGHFLIIGFAAGDSPAVPLNHALVKNITLSGFYWGGLFKLDPTAMQTSLSQIFGWYAKGEIAPHVSHRLPLSQTADGLDLLAQRKATGKVLILP